MSNEVMAGWKYSYEEMDKAFSAVSDPADWKAPIAALVPGEIVGLVCDAIQFFTATKPTVQIGWPKGALTTRILVTADGYRAGPAGDH